MTFRDLSRILLHWRRHPPAHIAIAGFERTYLAVHGVVIDAPATQKKPCFVDELALRSAIAQCGG